MNFRFGRDGQLRIPPALWLLLLLPLLAVLPPVPIDETRYLSIAWEMRQTGSWVTLHLNGSPYFDKPPLLFWLLNLGWSALGVSLWSSRALVVLCGVGCVALCQRLEKRLSPDASGQAPWLLLGLIFLALFTGVVMFDVLLCLCVLLGFVAIADYAQEGRTGALWWLFMASAFGLLAKGPVMLLHLAGPILIAPWWTASGPRASWRRVLTMLLVALLGGLPVLGWAWAAVHHLSTADADNLLLRQTAGRVVQSFAHNRPIWWYLPWTLVLLLPWPLLLRWRRLASAVRGSRLSRAARFGLCASVPGLIAFCVVSGKQLHYLLPLLPGATILLGAWLRGEPTLLDIRRMWVLIAAVAGVLAWAMFGHEPLGRGILERPTVIWLYLLAAGLLVLSIIGMLVGRRLRVEQQAAIVALLLALALLPLVRLQVLGALDTRDVARRVTALQAQGVLVARVPNDPGLITFLARLPAPLPEASEPSDWAREHPNGILLAYEGRGAAPDGTQNAVRLANGWVGLMPSSVALSNASVLDRAAPPPGD
ncbi:ArnT family glycosyltransferase [Dyella amyloliquefaciens]|uniref:ArnT family glycosyltransferase n=1 Tax=Dyella amyloliquefaciens TaxID=1770545 RepID=UPI0013EEA137|nr:glycosyltransferase family 39 protein [Dyella amyloliquefaciens]